MNRRKLLTALSSFPFLGLFGLAEKASSAEKLQFTEGRVEAIPPILSYNKEASTIVIEDGFTGKLCFKTQFNNYMAEIKNGIIECWNINFDGIWINMKTGKRIKELDNVSNNLNNQ